MPGGTIRHGDAPGRAADAPIPIANRALSLLGDMPITDLTDDSNRAIQCLAHYEPLVGEYLQCHDWNFASKRVANLPPRADPVLWHRETATAFELPPDCLRVRATSADRAEGGEGQDWQVEGLTIVATTPTLSIRYTARILEGLWRPAFTVAVVYELAARMAVAITAKPAYAELYTKLAAHKLSIAKALDGQEGAPRHYYTDVLIRDRR